MVLIGESDREGGQLLKYNEEPLRAPVIEDGAPLDLSLPTSQDTVSDLKWGRNDVFGRKSNNGESCGYGAVNFYKNKNVHSYDQDAHLCYNNNQYTGTTCQNRNDYDDITCRNQYSNIISQNENRNQSSIKPNYIQFSDSRSANQIDDNNMNQFDETPSIQFNNTNYHNNNQFHENRNPKLIDNSLQNKNINQFIDTRRQNQLSDIDNYYNSNSSDGSSSSKIRIRRFEDIMESSDLSPPPKDRIPFNRNREVPQSLNIRSESPERFSLQDKIQDVYQATISARNVSPKFENLSIENDNSISSSHSSGNSISSSGTEFVSPSIPTSRNSSPHTPSPRNISPTEEEANCGSRKYKKDLMKRFCKYNIYV